MFCRFAAKGRSRKGGPFPTPDPGAPNFYIARLLGQLRGRSVAVLVRGVEISGRVLSADSLTVTLVRGNGTVSIIPLRQVASVQF